VTNINGYISGDKFCGVIVRLEEQSQGFRAAALNMMFKDVDAEDVLCYNFHYMCSQVSVLIHNLLFLTLTLKVAFERSK